jgi:hypothetical protein
VDDASSKDTNKSVVGFAYVADKAQGAAVGGGVCALLFFLAIFYFTRRVDEVMFAMLSLTGTIGMLFGSLFSGGRIGWVGGCTSAGCLIGFLLIYARFMMLADLTMHFAFFEAPIILPSAAVLGFLVGAALELYNSRQTYSQRDPTVPE